MRTMVVVVVDGSVSGGMIVVTVVDGELVLVGLLDVVVAPGAVVVAPGVVVVAGAAPVTVNGALASSVVLKAWTVALPAVADGGTDTLPEKDGDPLESAVPIRVGGLPASTKSMAMQFGLSGGQAWKFVRVIVN